MKIVGPLRAVCLLGCLLPWWVGAVDYELVLRHGRVIDGSGNPAFFADVGIREGRIAALGRVSGTARETVDATGLVVAPGFIDAHTHAEDVAELPLAENFARMGVTTVIAGNCGSSVLEVRRFFRRLEGAGISVNVATLVGHGTVRAKIMGGSFDRAPTEAELGQMKRWVQRAMREGALGLSTGLIYLPGTYARTEEIIALAKEAAAYDGIYTSHIRDEGAGIMPALEEVFRIAREAGVRAEVSHIKVSGKPNWGRAAQVLAALEQARASGLDITQDQYVYTASSTGLAQLIPESAREGGRLAERLADPEQKARIVSTMKDRLRRGARTNYAYAVIAQYKPDASLNGLNIVEAARKARGADSLDEQIELILELQTHGGAMALFHGIDEADLQTFLAHPNTMLGSDSGVRRFGEGMPHPRGYGNNARVLARYVRELKLLRLEDAVRRMTSLPATTFRLQDRGWLREGAWADVVVFDPARVQDRAEFRSPHQYATGFACVLVKGVAVVTNDVHTGARPGQALRHLGNRGALSVERESVETMPTLHAPHAPRSSRSTLRTLHVLAQ
jgi:N-acyl-D-amino-acid deacylase